MDPWQLLCACALMSRVSSWAVKHNTISAFFERFPTPSAFLDANPEEVQARGKPGADPRGGSLLTDKFTMAARRFSSGIGSSGRIEESPRQSQHVLPPPPRSPPRRCCMSQVLIHPLGLFPTRMQSLVAITRRFLEAPLFNVGLEPELKVYGVGVFGVDSYRLFCRGDLKTNPEDKNLKSFVEWQRRNAAKRQEGGGGAAGEEAPEPVVADPPEGGETGAAKKRKGKAEGAAGAGGKGKKKK